MSYKGKQKNARRSCDCNGGSNVPAESLSEKQKLSTLDTVIRSQELMDLVAQLRESRKDEKRLREQVEPVKRKVLEDMPLYADRLDGRRILRPEQIYLSSDEVKCKEVLAEFNRRLRLAGLKPADMGDEYCPLLVAENRVYKIERQILDVTGKPFGVSAIQIIAANKEEKWIDLIVGAVESLH